MVLRISSQDNCPRIISTLVNYTQTILPYNCNYDQIILKKSICVIILKSRSEHLKEISFRRDFFRKMRKKKNFSVNASSPTNSSREFKFVNHVKHDFSHKFNYRHTTNIHVVYIYMLFDIRISRYRLLTIHLKIIIAVKAIHFKEIAFLFPWNSFGNPYSPQLLLRQFTETDIYIWFFKLTVK